MTTQGARLVERLRHEGGPREGRARSGPRTASLADGPAPFVKELLTP